MLAGALAVSFGIRAVARADPQGDDGALDEALEKIHGEEPCVRGGLSSHLPMGAEALCALGLSGDVLSWVGLHREPRVDLPEATRRIDPARWREALQLSRFGDWRRFFEDALEESDWKEVLDLWAGRLAPGLAGAATHGVIRTGHAVRALARRETKPRRKELARGLAYWAASYQELPARKREGAPAGSYEAAIAKLPLYRDANGSAPRGNIVAGLTALDGLEGFADARDSVAAVEDVSAALSDLTSTFARVYLRQGAKHDSIAFVHAVTAPCALRKLVPHVQAGTARAALPYVWQAAAGIYAAYAKREDATKPLEFPPARPRADIARRALEQFDVHSIKLTEAVLSENEVRPDPAYAAAAESILLW